MDHFWDTIIGPLLALLQPRSVVEIGAEDGLNTKHILRFCVDTDAALHVIDPLPRFPVDEWTAQSNGHLIVHRDISLNALADIADCDAVLIDGDHNWYTVYHELLLLEKHAGGGREFPLVFLHDVGWPYGRRDLYYDPDRIPLGYRKSFARKGMRPGERRLVMTGGLNRELQNAIEENDVQNGVLSAVEDFLKRTQLDLHFVHVPGFHGLGIIAPRALLAEKPELRAFIDSLESSKRLRTHVEQVEQARIWQALTMDDERQKSDTRMRDLAEQLGELLRQRETLQQEKDVLRADNAARQKKIDELQETIDRMRTHHAEQQKEIAAAMAARQKKIETEMRAQVEEREREAQEARDALQKILRSKSWRWTALFRRIDAALRSPAGVVLYPLFATGKRAWNLTGRPMPRLLRRIRHGMFGRIAPARSQVFVAAQTSASPQPPLPPSPADVAVILPCHNYGRFLAEALESVLAQTVKVRSILVVDDASTDKTADVARRYAESGVTYLRGEWHHVSRARNAGAMQTQSEFLLFLDSDDLLGPDYVERCLEKMQDPSVAVAYGDVWDFGASDARHAMPAFDRSSFFRSNYISSHALIRRQAFDLVGGFRPLDNAHEDWDLYRRILSYPAFTAKKADSYVRYRIHGGSRLRTYERTRDSRDYWHRANLLQSPVTVFTPFAGRRELLHRFAESIRALEFDPSLLRLHWFDTTGDASFEEQLRGELSRIPAGRATYTRAPLPDLWGHSPQTLIENRVSNARNAQYYYEMAVVYAYNNLLASCDTEYVLILEDDVLPSPSALRQMLQTVTADVSGVVAHYPCHLQHYSMVWSLDQNGYPVHFKKRRSGIEEVGGSGFGCSLLRTSALRRHPIYTRVFDPLPRWYDYVAFGHLADEGRVLCNWDIEVEHVPTDRGVEVTEMSR